MILQSLMLKTLYKEGSKEGESRKVWGDEDGKRAVGRRREEACVSIPRHCWPVFLGHFVFWEMMLPLGKCLFS